MVRDLDPNQDTKIARTYIQPIYLVHLSLLHKDTSEPLTLYFSDRDYNYNGHDYEAYIKDLSNIGNEVRNLGGYDNANVVLEFVNKAITISGPTTFDTLIDLLELYPTEKRYIEIYKLLIDTGETFVTDVSTKVFKGEMRAPYEIFDPPIGFKVDVSSMLFGKNSELPFNVINYTLFPQADPDDVGKYRNIIYGSVKKVICPWTVAGWVSTLTADITINATSFVVSYCKAGYPPNTPFTATIDNEEVRVTARTGESFTTVERGYNGTTPKSHSKGTVILEELTSFEAEVAQHPVKSIDNVYIKRGNIWFRVLTGITKEINYFDQNWGYRARVVFSDKITFEQQIDISAENEIDEGTHPHDLSFAGYSNKKCYPTGSSGGTNPANAIDGNENTYASATDAQVLNVTFTEDNLGTINKQYIYILHTSATGIVESGNAQISAGLTAPGIKSWTRLVKTTANGWGDDIDITGIEFGDSIYEVYKEVEYTPTATADTHAASGVDVVTTITGNSVANTTIGDLVACDVEGYADDGSYGQEVGTLIERPDHIRRHILMALLGFVVGDIGDTFDTVGTIYQTAYAGDPYKFAFVLHEVATETMDLFEKLDLCSQTNMIESGGKFELKFNDNGSYPPIDFTFSKNNVKGSFIFGKTGVSGLKTKIRGYYFRDYSKTGSLGDIYGSVVERGGGEQQEDIELSCIGDYGMAESIADWLWVEKRNLKKTVQLQAYWDAMILEHCDYFTVTSTIAAFNNLYFKTVKLIERPSDQLIDIEGLEFSSSGGV